MKLCKLKKILFKIKILFRLDIQNDERYFAPESVFIHAVLMLNARS